MMLINQELICILLGILPFILVSARPGLNKEDLFNNEVIYDAFKSDLVKNYGVKEEFAVQLKDNLKKAIIKEIKQSHLRQEDEEDDDDDASTTTTEGPSPLAIVNGIYGILSGVGTLNPDKIFASTVNFFPPSQKDTAQALIASALGQKTMFPTPTTTKPTTSTASTTTKDEDYDEYDEETTKSAIVLAVTAAPAAASSGVVTVSGAAVQSVTAASASALPKYTIQSKDPVASAVSVPVTVIKSQETPVILTSRTSASVIPLPDDEADLENLVNIKI